MESGISHQEIGFVVSINGYLLNIKGLPSAKINDIIVNREGDRAIVYSLHSEYITALLLDNNAIETGEQFYIHSSKLSINISDNMRGKVLNALGSDVDRDDLIPESGDGDEPLEFETKAPGVDVRDFIDKQLFTGFNAVDIMVPIGKGQRELIYGPIHSGKNKFLREVVLNQKKQNVLCIYASIGKPVSFVKSMLNYLNKNDVLDNTIIVSALSDEPSPMITIAPSTALLIVTSFLNRLLIVPFNPDCFLLILNSFDTFSTLII